MRQNTGDPNIYIYLKPSTCCQFCFTLHFTFWLSFPLTIFIPNIKKYIKCPMKKFFFFLKAEKLGHIKNLKEKPTKTYRKKSSIGITIHNIMVFKFYTI